MAHISKIPHHHLNIYFLLPDIFPFLISYFMALYFPTAFISYHHSFFYVLYIDARGNFSTLIEGIFSWSKIIHEVSVALLEEKHTPFTTTNTSLKQRQE